MVIVRMFGGLLLGAWWGFVGTIVPALVLYALHLVALSNVVFFGGIAINAIATSIGAARSGRKQPTR